MFCHSSFLEQAWLCELVLATKESLLEIKVAVSAKSTLLPSVARSRASSFLTCNSLCIKRVSLNYLHTYVPHSKVSRAV